MNSVLCLRDSRDDVKVNRDYVWRGNRRTFTGLVAQSMA